MKRLKRICAILPALCLLAGCSGGSSVSTQQQGSLAQELATEEGITMGVAVYALDNDEVRAIRDYLENYLGEAFEVSFLYSDAIESAEQEIAFVQELAEQGVQGCISFLSSYMEEVLPVYQEYGIYYVSGSCTIGDDTFAAVKDYSCFLGTIGPTTQAEEQAGFDIAHYFAQKDSSHENHYLIFVGGSGMGNEMHALRAQGMLLALAECYGLSYAETVENLVQVTEETLVDTGTEVTILLVPGYTGQGERVEALAAGGEFNIILSVQALGDTIDTIAQVEKTAGVDIQVGMLDCFSQANYQYFNTLDSYGSSKLNYLVGKYGAVVAPAFAALLNAYSGYAQEFQDQGEAFRLYQSYWYADSAESFNEQYAAAVSTFDNTYSALEILNVLKEYNPQADFALFKEFAEK